MRRGTASYDLGKALSASGAMKASSRIPVAYRLVSVDTAGGKTLAKISVTMNGGAAIKNPSVTKVSILTRGEMVVDVATGLLRSSTSVSDTDLTTAAGAMHQATSLRR